MLKNESSYKSVANAKPKLWQLKAQKLSIFAMKWGATQKLAVLNNKLRLTGDYAIKVMIFSHSNDNNFGKSKRFLVSLNRFFEFLMNVVHMI